MPSAPAAPNRPIFLTLVLIVAGGAGIAAAFVAGQLQTTFPTPLRLVQVTGLKVLGTVSEVVNAAERFRRRKKLVLLAGTAGGARRRLLRADAGRILAARLGCVRNDMARHIPQSLLERAAELYDFGAALARARAAPAPVAEPAPCAARAGRAGAPARTAPRRRRACSAPSKRRRRVRARQQAWPRSTATCSPPTASSSPKRR